MIPQSALIINPQYEKKENNKHEPGVLHFEIKQAWYNSHILHLEVLYMKLNYDRKSKDPTYFIQQGIRNGKKVTTNNVKRIGKHSELLAITSDPLYITVQKI